MLPTYIARDLGERWPWVEHPKTLPQRADLRKCGEQPFAVEIDQMRLPVDQGSGAKRLAARIGKRDISILRRK